MTLDHVLEARRRIAAAIRPTPLMQHPLLSEELGCDVWVKHENHNPTGAFKVRGGVNLMSQIADAGRCLGVITASTGNHGQSIAFGSRQFGIPCTVAVPVGNNPEKNAAMRALGATVLETGRDFDEARGEVERIRVAQGL